jgi:ligand-binding sensor domain-containing protein
MEKSGSRATDLIHDHAAAFCLVVDQGTKCYGKADGVFIHDAVALAQDADGNLWSSNPAGAVSWNPGSFKTYQPEPMKSKKLIQGVVTIVSTSGGLLWVGMGESGAGLGLQQLDHGMWKPYVTSNFDSSTLPVRTLLLDRQGVLCGLGQKVWVYIGSAAAPWIDFGVRTAYPATMSITSTRITKVMFG